MAMVRVGIHAGEVVALQVDDGAHAGWDALAPAVPLAARMEQTAAPSTIQLTASTFDKVKSHFHAEVLEPAAAKGIAEPVAAVRLVRAKDVANSASIDTAFRLVGRVSELEQIEAALNACIHDGFGHTICRRGEAGVG